MATAEGGIGKSRQSTEAATARKISERPDWLTGITLTPIQFADDVIHGELELHTEEGTITFEITEEVAEGTITATHQFRVVAKAVVKSAG